MRFYRDLFLPVILDNQILQNLFINLKFPKSAITQGFSQQKHVIAVLKYLGMNTFANKSFVLHPLSFRKTNIFEDI